MDVETTLHVYWVYSLGKLNKHKKKKKLKIKETRFDQLTLTLTGLTLQLSPAMLGMKYMNILLNMFAHGSGGAQVPNPSVDILLYFLFFR